MMANSKKSSRIEKMAIIVGNWKMYKTIEESQEFVKNLLPFIQEGGPKVYLAVPFTLIRPVSDEASQTPLVVGAQNMNDAEEGAFTGEIAGKMLVDAGAKFVILGHSERRRLFNETDEFINKKVRRALKDGLQPVLCVGETWDEREAGQTKKVLEEQLKICLAGVKKEEIAEVIIAYEPVWAIGAPLPATKEMAEEAISYCRTFIEESWREPAIGTLSILYGGAVNADNADSFLSQPNIDGLLVGGASLTVEAFSKIINRHFV
ncbi:MAG TPA: triose-phosphate isomerase [Parachlamydiaceae bacterium]|nr:triose-phosphate isomerase [Parachlamydiaceae bacterium]